MPLENMNVMLGKSADTGYAVGAFNILDYNSTKAVVLAAEGDPLPPYPAALP
jgi:fructose/tagatose bisphosphate aldolase